VAQVLECLPSKDKALNSNPSKSEKRFSDIFQDIQTLRQFSLITINKNKLSCNKNNLKLLYVSKDLNVLIKDRIIGYIPMAIRKFLELNGNSIMIYFTMES
jgi:hypothetical protein